MRKRGYRVTPQRQLILDAVCEGRGHTTLAEILERLWAKAPAINQATVYRTLHFLCDLRLVVAMDLGDGCRVYEIAGETPHHHLVCRRCGRIEQLSHTAVAPLFARIERQHRFKADMDLLRCRGCARSAAAQNSDLICRLR